MAAATQSRILNKIKKNTKGAWKESREKAAEVKGARLPGGIIGGIATFLDFKFGETDDKKIPYLTILFLCREPDEYAGVKQSVRYYFESTKYKTVDEVCDRLSSDLQLMGRDTAGTTEDDWQRLLTECKEEQVAILYNTRTGTTDDGNEWFSFDIQGVADDYEPPDIEPMPEPTPDPEPEAEEESEPETPAEDLSDDFESLGSQADEGEADAIDRLTELAEQHDLNPDDFPESWSDLANAIAAIVGGEEEASKPAAEDDDGWVPESGDVYYYKPNPRASKEEYEVTSVDVENERVTLSRSRDGAIKENVPWDKLEGDE